MLAEEARTSRHRGAVEAEEPEAAPARWPVLVGGLAAGAALALIVQRFV
jgi:predicted lipid-binding transport protein (Tim44 family)